jgi:hypothetical protein
MRGSLFVGSLLWAAIQQPFKARVAMLVQRHELAIQDGWLFQFSKRFRDRPILGNLRARYCSGLPG